MVLPNLVDGKSTMSEGKKKKWMKAAVPEDRKGVFTKKAEAAGKSVHEYAEEEKHAGGTIGKEANLALTFEKQAHKKKHKSAGDRMKKMYGSKKE